MPPTSFDGQPQQKDKTIQYWDHFYSNLDASVQAIRLSPHPSATNTQAPAESGERLSTHENSHLDACQESKGSSSLEWIIPNSPPLLDMVLNAFPGHSENVQGDNGNSIRILEIGCGVSRLSRSLLEHARNRRETSEPRTNSFYSFVATDVSSVCLERNLARDADFISALKAINSSSAGDSLSYEVLDIVKEATVTFDLKRLGGKFDVCLDKGTFDTFLFRSKRTKKGTSPHPPLLISLLNNIHRILRQGCHAKYMIVSPRSKIKSIRDFRGFSSVRRRVLNSGLVGELFIIESNKKKESSNIHGKDLENESKKPDSDVYLYECTINDCYKPGVDKPFRDAGSSVADDSFCMNCGVTFLEFRGNVEICNQGEVCWARRWRGHCIHCRGGA